MWQRLPALTAHSTGDAPPSNGTVRHHRSCYGIASRQRRHRQLLLDALPGTPGNFSFALTPLSNSLCHSANCHRRFRFPLQEHTDLREVVCVPNFPSTAELRPMVTEMARRIRACGRDRPIPKPRSALLLSTPLRH